MRNTATAWVRRLACSSSAAAAAADSSTSEAFCWVTRSISATARPTWSIPRLCSSEAEAISPMISVTRVTAFTISPMVSPALSTSVEPTSTRPTESSIRLLISRAAWALRWARLRTSPATTAKPRPCSPARAASTAAFSARMLVWKAIPSITLIMSAIFCELPAISRMVCTTLSTTLPPFCAVSDALSARWLA